MLLADVTKIKCKFVQEIINFLNKRKYAVDPCVKCKYTYYADALKLLYPPYTEPIEGSGVFECLDHETECDLTTKASKYPEQASCLTNEECLDQVTITLAQAVRTCSSLAETINSQCSCKFPRMYTTNNSTLVNGTIDIKTTFSGTCSNPATTSSESVIGGCNSADGCIDDNQSYYSFGFNSNSTSVVTDTSFLTRMRVYLTDGAGAITTMKDLLLTPGANDYQADDPVLCPGCTAIPDAELVFGHANFEDAFSTLMDNVSLALFGVTGLHNMYAWWNGTHYRIRCKAVHNPTGTHLFGLNRNDATIYVSTPSGTYSQGINAFGDFDAAPYYPPVRFYYEASLIEAPGGGLYNCADIESTIGDQVAYPNYNTLLSNMNKIVLTTSLGNSSYPIEVTDGISGTCESVILSASYTTDKEVDSVEWQDPSSIQISTSTLASATVNGTYTFYLYLANGCTITETIEVTAFP